MKYIFLGLALSSISLTSGASECRIHSYGKGQICGLAKADETVYIGPKSKISGNVLITGKVTIINSQITGTKENEEASGIWGKAEILNSTLSGLYKISGNVEILGSKNKDSIKLLGENGKITLYNNANIIGDKISISGTHTINGNVLVGDGTTMMGTSNMWGQAKISKALVKGKLTLSDKAVIKGDCKENKECIKIVSNNAGINIYGNAKIYDQVSLNDQVVISGKVKATDKASFNDRAQVYAGTFEDQVALSDSSYVWGNKTHLTGNTKVTGTYNVFNIQSDKGFFKGDDPEFKKEMFSSLTPKLLEDLNSSLTTGQANNKAVSLRYSLSGAKLKATSMNEANNFVNHLFTTFNERLKDTSDGCFLRAHVASLEADKKGIETSKIVVITPHALSKPVFKKMANNSRLLRFNNGKVDHKWVSHYSNLIMIKDHKGNEIPYVIDPAMSKKPMTVKQWTKLVTKETKPKDNKALLSFIVMPKQVYHFYSYLRDKKSYEPIYNRAANTDTLLNLLDEIGHESSIMAENYK